MLPTISGVFNAAAAPNTGTYQDGTNWALLRCAANKSRKDDNGQWQNVAVFYVTLYATGYLAERVAGAGPGDKFYASGELTTDEWEDQSGNRRQNTRLRARDIAPIQQQGGQGRAAGHGQPAAAYGQSAASGAYGGRASGGHVQGFGDDDEPPF